MRKSLSAATILLLVAVSCIEKDPSWIISWGSGGSGQVEPAPQPQPQPGPDTTVKIIPTDVPLLEAFTQDFSNPDTAPFDLALYQGRDDFRYYPGFPSLTESATDILLLRMDPEDAPSDCPQFTASAHTFYGSYSIRVMTPDLSRVKKTTDAVFEFSLQGNDPRAGVSGIGLNWELSSPSKMTVTSLAGTSGTQSGNSVAVMVPDGCSPSERFQTCGWDWTPESVVWWIINPSTKERTVIGEISSEGEVPFLPAVLKVCVKHTTDAPEYPFETQIDRISYEPYPDLIQAWRDKYFK